MHESMNIKLKKKFIWSVDVCGSETCTIGKDKESVVNAFKTWCWRRMLKVKWTYRITNDKVHQGVKEERLLLKMF
jgi:hypothetical protein